MRFAEVQVGRAAHLAIVDADHAFLLAPLAQRAARSRTRPGPRARPADAPDDLLSFIEHGSMTQARAALALGRRLLQDGRAGGVAIPLARARLLAPFRPPKNIFCVGRNYAAHAQERGEDVPTVPMFFTKPPTCVVGPNVPVTHHRVTTQLDYEVELAVIIGRRGRDITAGRALDYVFGYTILNDVSARDLQARHGQWFKGKSLDTFAPMGPVVVHRSAISDPQSLRLRLRVNGEVRQEASTASMIFTVARLIESLSAGMTLEPGDVLATGTPEGVGAGRTPPAWLRPGDVMEAEIDGIGVLRNPIVAP